MAKPTQKRGFTFLVDEDEEILKQDHPSSTPSSSTPVDTPFFAPPSREPSISPKTLKASEGVTEVITLKDYDDVKNVVMRLINKQSVIVNLELFRSDAAGMQQAEKAMAYLSGACFVLGITIQRINDVTFYFPILTLK